uniref:Uncharacterized protein n=1 Tax=Rhizophora mucronata TaxID=61149 RepID=A0A2P2R595_RHIMU
MSLILEMEVH